ncbi:MAG: hypothetical protein ACO1QS_03600 [Verrucomicrobiota bacterium]
MRFTWVVLLAVVLSFGCASKPVQEESQFVDKTSEIKAPAQPKEKNTRKVKDKDADKPEVAPANELAGKIIMVNDTLRYVVVDFGFGRLPQAEQRLGVYRGGNKIAEIKISAHSRNSNFAADIVTGTVQMGDEVKQ